MISKRFLKNTVIYFLLLLGYVYFYVVNVEVLVDPASELEPKSTVTFVYQEF